MSDNDKYGIIYKLTFPNGKMYIGQTTKTLAERIKGHNIDSHKAKYPVHKAIKSFGIENVKSEIIEYCDTQEELDEREQYWIKELNTMLGTENCNGYNVVSGGQCFTRVTLLSVEELKAFGDDYRAGMHPHDLFKKYNITDKHFGYYIYNGKTFSKFTGIPLRNYKTDPKGLFVRKDIDYILERFKECGRTEIIADEMNVDTDVILKVIKGKTWNEYTGIKNNTFYEKYHQWSKNFTNEEILKIAELKKKNKTATEVQKIIGHGTLGSIKAIMNGSMFEDKTGLPKTTWEDFKNNHPNASLTKEDVLNITKLKEEGKTTSEIHKMYSKVKLGTIESIISGKAWNHVTGIKFIPYGEREIKINATLTKEQVLQIVELLKTNKTGVEIAKIVGTSPGIVSSIKNGRTWNHITGFPKNKKQ